MDSFVKINILHKMGETRRRLWYGFSIRALKNEPERVSDYFHHFRKLSKGKNVTFPLDALSRKFVVYVLLHAFAIC